MPDPQPPARDSLENLLHQPAGGETLDIVDAPEGVRKAKVKRKPKPAGGVRAWIKAAVIVAVVVLVVIVLPLIMMDTNTKRDSLVAEPVVTVMPELYATPTRIVPAAPLFLTTPTASYEFETPLMLNAVIDGLPIGTRVQIGSTWFDGTTRWYNVTTESGVPLEVSEAQLVPVP